MDIGKFSNVDYGGNVGGIVFGKVDFFGCMCLVYNFFVLYVY